MQVDQVYRAYKGERGDRLRGLRQLILDVAETTDGVGQIEECLKWGQPSFVTHHPKSGGTIRIDAVRDTENRYAMYVTCSTNLIDQFKELYRDSFEFEGNRAIIFKANENIPEEELRHCIAIALTYHLKRSSNRHSPNK